MTITFQNCSLIGVNGTEASEWATSQQGVNAGVMKLRTYFTSYCCCSTKY